jgi:hypothetical protein
MTKEYWYILKQPGGHCEIVSAQAHDANPESAEGGASAETGQEQWGPFASRSEAIARRVGLIRAGKCRPQ